MGWIIFFLFVGGFLWLGIIGSKAEKQQDIASQESRRTWLEKRERDKEALAGYCRTRSHEWPLQVAARVDDGVEALFSIAGDDNAMLIESIHYDGFEMRPYVNISMSDLISAEIARNDVRESYMRTELVPVSVKNKKSPVGRAIVGGLVAGPAGMMVGAASGLGGKSSIKHEERSVRDTRVVKGPAYVVLGTTSRVNPIVKLRFGSESDTEHWLHQVRAAKARHNSRSGMPLPLPG